ncbi:MAG: histidine kinase [Kordiimonadaceae bacterium]|nr:histidine kinase [Kordiimonadaceae bacterium]MBT6033862.1 histidine kinase [Kordiimonadaceae bacterium]
MEQIFFIEVQIYEFIAVAALYDVFVLLLWTSAYYIINYQFLFIKQKEMYLKAVAQAHQSQLQMLRYQINPHFLFNTLNAISTLVLDKQSKEANGMLTKLSAFLRFSLVNQPTQKITIKEEVYALWLYLDIEKVRFEERLKLEFNISDEANTAMIPSLLLQPLVENAIKYAIAPMEDGGIIMLDISVENFSTRLDITLRDTGPGISDTPTEHKYNENSSGVGLENTKNRLKELYPNDFKLTIENHAEGGVLININIPFETEKGNSDAK